MSTWKTVVKTQRERERERESYWLDGVLDMEGRAKF